ncbi:MAG TPA: hypothetical protein VF109_06030 [Mycobacteriales bacterium]
MPRRPERGRGRRLVVALLAGLAVTGLWAATAGAAPRLDVAAVVPVPSARYVSLVAGVRPAPPTLPPGAFRVTVGGAPVPATAMPVVSDELVTGLVLDTSAAGGAALQGGVNGSAGYLLQLPTGARTLVVTDGGPPAVLVPLGWEALDAVSALNSIQAGGRRDTGAALDLALSRLPEIPGRPRVLMLYTGAADAGGEPAESLSARLRASGVLLTVVATGSDQRYWSRVAGETGGLLVTARGQAALRAFDEVASVLNGRYVVTLPMPAELPAQVEVRVTTPRGTAAATATVPGTPPPPAAAPSEGRSVFPLVLALLAALAAGTAAAAAVFHRRLRGPSGRAAPEPGTPAQHPPPPARPGQAGPHDPSALQPSASAVPAAQGRWARAAEPAGEPAPRAPVPPPAAPEESPVPEPRRPSETEDAASTDPDAAGPPTAGPAAAGPPTAGPPTAGPPAVRRDGPGRDAGQDAVGREGAGRDAGGQDGAGRDASRDDAGRGGDVRDAGQDGAGGDVRDADEMAYQRLDATVGRVAADVAAGRMDFRRGVARIAMSAPGRPDLLDRVLETERRLRGAHLGASPPSDATLDLLTAARSVVAGEVALIGPSGVRVEQAPASPHPVLRLRSRNGPVRECRSLDELARHVDLSALTVDRQNQ